MLLSTLTHSRRFSARVTNVSTNTDLSDYIDSIDISMPRLSEISTMTTKFQTDEVMVAKGNEILIEVLDEVGNTIYSLSGEATVTNVEHNYTGRSKYSYEVKEEYTRLFERVIVETEVFFDLYVCNNADKANSLMHIIGQKLGFKEFDFRDYLERVPFIVFNEGDRWIDELQSLISATGSIIYVFNKKLVFRPCNFNLNRLLLFNDRNIITNISRRFKGQNINGTKVLYDRFERLDNQVVFNLASKIIVDENTGLDKDVQSMRINYITSSVASPTITRASGYYFTTDSPDSRVDVALKSGSDYVIKEMKSTGLIVKFYNARPHKLYIDNFEIKGMPLVKYTDNSAVVKDSNVANEAEENFRKLNKNKYIQTLKQAENLCNAEYIRGKSEYTYEFDTQFIPDGLNLGEVYNLEIKGINTLIELESYSIHLKPSDFRIKVKGRQVELDVQVKQSNTGSLNSDTQFVDLKPIHQAIDKNAKQIQETNKNLQLASNTTNKVITQLKQELTQGIQDSKVKVYTLKPPLNTLTDANIGDIYAADGNVEVLVKQGNKLTWERIADKQVEETLNNYMQETNNRMIAISYQSQAPAKNNEGDIWIDTANDGVWYRWNGKEWQQVDKSVREALKKANTDINKIEKSITTINNTINNKIMAKAFIQEQEPSTGMKNYDVWYKKSNNTYKVYLNGKWSSASEDDIFPALRHYASLSNAQLEIGTKLGQVDNFAKTVNSKADNINDAAKKAQNKADEAYKRAGIFLTNNDQKFGTKNGTLAEVSLDKEGAIRLSNANNLLEWNVKDPKDPKRMRSKFYMGVSDISKIPDDVYFKVGDEATGFTIELKEGKSIAKVDGAEISEKFNQVETNLKSSIETLKKETAQHNKTLENIVNTKTSEVLNVANSKINSLESTVNSKTKTLENNIGGVKQEIKGVTNTLTKDIDSKVSGVNSKIDTKTKELTGRIDTQIANVSKTVESKVNGVKQEMSKELTDYTNKLKTQIAENIARLESADSKIAGELKKETEKILTEQRKSTEDYKRTLDDILNRTYYLSLLPHAKMLYPDPEFANGRNSTDTYEWVITVV